MSDKAEILSEAEVDFLLMAEKAAEPTAGAPSVDEQAVTMRGDLDQINLADIFQTLAMSKMEGVLRIRNPLEERQIHVHDGFLRAYVPARLATRRLGQRLVQAGLVNEEQLRVALIEQRTNKKPIGQLLVAAGYVAQTAIDEIVGAQIAEDLFALFTWRHGTFEFYKGEPSEALLEVFVGCPEYEVSSLLLEVARRSDEWQLILDALGSLDEVPHALREAAADEALAPVAVEVARAANGRFTWREIANQTTHGMFEVARAARDLVRSGLLGNLDETAMVELAASDADTGQPKRALVLLQTLRDRAGERPLATLQAMASVLQNAGERRLAGNLLLEAAQRHTESQVALDLARAARDLSPHDVGTLSFLRTVLIAHAPADSPELEKCTLDLLDSLVEADLVPTALEIIDDARRTGTAQPAILMREVRARQKARDAAGATRVLEELAQIYDQRGQPQQALETYAALLRLDRSRKDVQRLIAQRRRTRLGQMIRLAAAAVVLLMVAGMGLVFWQQQQWSRSVASADQEISALLVAGDHAGARARVEHWREQLGECEATEDLHNRVAFAEAAEAGRQQKAWRERLNVELAAAGASMQRGEVGTALDRYETLLQDAKSINEVTEILGTRIDALLQELGQACKVLQSRTLHDPSKLLDRQDLLKAQAEFESLCPPSVVVAFRQLEQRHREGRLAATLGPERAERAGKVLADVRAVFERAQQLANGYAAALTRSDQQRQLDPLFKAAVESERAFDFASALAKYRELERQSTDDATMRGHFRDRVARNATIVRLLDALDAATKSGDFPTAIQQLRALRLSFPDVPFDRFVRVPLRIDSRPAGAMVRSNGKDLGPTPLSLSRAPSESLALEVISEGFRGEERTIRGEETDRWFALLALQPDRSLKCDSLVEVRPLRSGTDTVVVDRGGNVTALTVDGPPRWRYRSDDLSGLLTSPCPAGDAICIGSLDGELRALATDTGEVRWSIGDLPTELTPLLHAGRLIVATTDRQLHCFNLPQRTRASIELAQPPVGLVAGADMTVCVLGDHGHLTAIDVVQRETRWQRDLPTRSTPRLSAGQGQLLITSDTGQVVAVAAKTGVVQWQVDTEREVLGPAQLAGADVWVATRTHLVRLDAATGAITSTIPAEDGGWTGPLLIHGNRLLAPVRSGVQVLDLGTRELLYRLATGRSASVHAIGSEVWTFDADRQAQVYPSLR